MIVTEIDDINQFNRVSYQVNISVHLLFTCMLNRKRSVRSEKPIIEKVHYHRSSIIHHFRLSGSILCCWRRYKNFKSANKKDDKEMNNHLNLDDQKLQKIKLQLTKSNPIRKARTNRTTKHRNSTKAIFICKSISNCC